MDNNCKKTGQRERKAVRPKTMRPTYGDNEELIDRFWRGKGGCIRGVVLAMI